MSLAHCPIHSFSLPILFIHFQNKKQVYTEAVAMQEARKAALTAASNGGGGATAAAAMDTDDTSGVGAGWTVASDAQGQAAQLVEVEAALSDARRGIKAEDEKFAAWKMENVRRKHNYIPFVVALFRMLAERGQLKGMIEKANSSSRE